MHPLLRNSLALLSGLLLGGFLNMGIIMINSMLITPPSGPDITTLEGLTAAMPLMGPEHFLLPFLAHALGTFVASWLACRFGTGNKSRLAFVCAGLFLIGGALNVLWLPAPLWFEAIDLLGAYFPMAWLGAKLGAKAS